MPTRSPSLEKVVENDNANENVESLDHGVLNLKLLSPLGITIVLLTGFAQFSINIHLIRLQTRHSLTKSSTLFAPPLIFPDF